MQDNNNHLFLNHKCASHLGYVLQYVDSHNGEAEVALFHVSCILLGAAGYPKVMFCSWGWKKCKSGLQVYPGPIWKSGKGTKILHLLGPDVAHRFWSFPLCQNQWCRPTLLQRAQKCSPSLGSCFPTRSLHCGKKAKISGTQLAFFGCNGEIFFYVALYRRKHVIEYIQYGLWREPNAEEDICVYVYLGLDEWRKNLELYTDNGINAQWSYK